MTILYPESRQVIVDRISTDVQAELPESEPFLRESFLRALIVGYASGDYDLYTTVKELQKQMFPDSATGAFADRWGSYVSVYRNPATPSTGKITVTGSVGATLPLNTIFQAGNGTQFSTQAEATLSLHSTNISSLVRSGTLVTATTSGAHYFATNNIVTIANVVETDYNGDFTIIVTSETTFTYEIATTPSTPATGLLNSVSLISASVLVKSIDYGVTTNFDSGVEMFIASAVAGIDTSAFVQFTGISGGFDLESDAAFKIRYMYKYQNPVAYFNVSEIVAKAEEVAGVTRVFVQEITPDVGQVTVLFMRDNDKNSTIPTSDEVTTVKNKLLELKPAHVNPDDLIVASPTPNTINFHFNVLEPHTDTILAAIKANLAAFFAEVPIPGVVVSKTAYMSVIYYTVDPVTGAYINNFVLAYPTTDIITTSKQIAVLGTVTWS